jgi:hypothetical protein
MINIKKLGKKTSKYYFRIFGTTPILISKEITGFFHDNFIKNVQTIASIC